MDHRFDFARGFDPLGRVLTTQYPGGELATWHYDRRLLARISTSRASFGGDEVADVACDALERPRF